VSTTAVERVHELVEPLATELGLELVDVEQAGPLLRIRLDRPDGGIDLDTVAAASQAISQLLDRHDPLPARYTLEVSSPGVERPLRTPEHFQRFVGRTVSVRTHPGAEGTRRVEGTLTAADDEGIVVGDHRLAYADIERARTTFSWGPAPKPGSPRAKTAKQPKPQKKALTP
jgi:ribosome maturation factor RimP